MRIVLGTIALGLGVDFLSFIVWASPGVSPWITGALLLGVALLAFRIPAAGALAVLLELLWGSHGRLFVVPVVGVEMTVRMGVFVIALAACAWHLRRPETRATIVALLRAHPARWPMAAFLASIGLAGVLGVFRTPFGQWVADANAWGFLALIPVFLLAASHGFVDSPRIADTRMGVEGKFVLLITCGALYLIVRAYMFLFLFSHDFGGLWVPAYQWVRDTRLGEITVSPDGFPRVFLPSFVLLFPAALLAVSRMTRIADADDADTRITRALWIMVFGGGTAILLVSLSRSYWFAGVALSVLVILVMLWKHGLSLFHTKMRKVLRVGVVSGVSAIVALAFAAAVVRFPYPKPLSTVGLSGAFASRLVSDAAVSNRWQELHPLWEAIRERPLLGHGFGAAVTYETKDPRTLTAFPDGRYTTTAFEWGYLDDWLERGLIGMLIELWLIGALVWSAVRPFISPPHVLGRGSQGGWLPVPAALAGGLTAIALVHATSPYLNHPLGLGVLMLAFAATAGRRRTTGDHPKFAPGDE